MAVEVRRPHKHVSPAEGGSHQGYAWWHANTAARLAQALTPKDVRRQSLELDTGDVWEVVTTSPPTWRKMAGAHSPMLEQLAARAPQPVQHVYVTATGSDTAAGTVAAPLRTLAGAWALLPAVQAAHVVVHLGSGSHEWTDPPALVQRAYSILVIGDGAGQPGDDGFEVLATGTVAPAGSTLTSISTVDALTPGGFTGCTIEMLTGAAAGNRRGIADNGATSVRLAAALTAPGNVTATPGDTFRIVRSSVVIERPTVRTSIWIPSAVRVSFASLALNAACVVWADGCGWWGVELRAGNLTLQTGVRLAAGSQIIDSTALLVDALGLVPSRWQGWGLLCRSTWGYGAPNSATEDALTGYVCLADFILVAPGNISGGRAGGVNLAGTVRLRFAGTFLLSGSGRPISMQQAARLQAFTLDVVDVRTTQTTSIGLTEQAELCCSTLTLTAASLPNGAVPIDNSGQSRMQVSTLSVSASCAHAVRLGDGSSIVMASLITTGIVSLFGASKLAGQVLNCGPLLVYGTSEVSIGNAGTTCSALVQGSMPGSGAVVVDGNARVSFGWHGGGYGTVSIMNVATAASSDGVRCKGGGSLFSVVAPTVGTAGSSGFGINARGGGRVMLPSVAAVSGPTADCTVGTAFGDDFSKSDLSTALSGRVSGVSAIQRYS